MKQQQFFKPSRREHGGILNHGKRKSRRPLSTKEPIHLTLRSEYAKGARSLLYNQVMIRAVIKKASIHFNVRVYELAICGNHLHLLVRGKARRDLQNFFRVVAGHIAQKVLMRHPYTKHEKSKTSTEQGLAPILKDGHQKRGSAPNPRGSAPNPRCHAHRTRGSAPGTAEGSAHAGARNSRKFWDLLIYSRLLTWGREFKRVTEYIQRNTLEALNLIAYKPRVRHRGLSGFS